MLHTKWIVTLLLVLISFSNFAAAADNQSYVVSFIAASSGLGLVRVSQNGNAELLSIYPVGKTLGSTAVDSYMDYWAYGTSHYVWVISGDAEKNLSVDLILFGEDLQPYHFGASKKVIGHYHPLHLFRTAETDRSGAGIPDSTSLLTAGNGANGSNNYVSHFVKGGSKTKIFVNPKDHVPGTAAISPDGGLVSQMTFKGLNHFGVIGRLINGKLTVKPFQWLNMNDFQGYSQSLSNPIGQKKRSRYLAYRNFKQSKATDYQSQVMIQNVDATTGKPQGLPRSITKLAKARNVNAEKIQSIVISPDGRLILYTSWSDTCQKQILLARKLENGSSVRNPTIVVGCRELEKYPVGIYGINITSACPRIDYHSWCQ